MTAVAALLQITEEILWLHALVFLRVAPITGLLPGLGEQSVPMRFKLLLALGFTAVVAPVIAPELAQAGRMQAPAAATILSETVIGLLIGIGLRLFLMTLQMAGSIAAQATSLAQILGNAGATPLPSIGHLLELGGLALMMVLGLHLRVAELIVHSYGLFPVADWPRVADVSQWGVARIAHAFAFAFALAAPFILVSVLYNLTLGIINRAMPQLMVVFVGAPVISGLALLLLMLVAPGLLMVWARGFAVFISNPFGG